ncbi:uncharacterized protein LOC130821241 [Amaranthus tricolor]|uniref:uncharacterized protein LOC130821241 n=1 Tax=Amaranthus tricolor TaxID=29722 RepID=UPI00258C996C|nr:uncharacterized protein LOC130821241 [Amaranthus tricolor]
MLSTKLIFNVAWYPQLDDKRRVTNKTLGHILKNLVEENNKDWSENLAHSEIAHNGNPHLHSEHFSFACMYDLNPWNATTLVYLLLQDKGVWNTRKPTSIVPHTAAQVQTVAKTYSVDAANNHDVSPYHTNLELRKILFQEGGIEPYQLGSNGDSSKDSRSNPRRMEFNNNKSNKHHHVNFYGVCIASDFMHIRPLSTHDKEIKINQNNKEDHELIMGKKGQEFEASNEYRRPAATQDQRHQHPLTNSIDQANLAGLPRRTLSPFDDVKDIIGISTLEPSHHGPKVLRMIIGSMWKSEAKVTQSTCNSF